jgi:hypothetical protein
MSWNFYPSVFYPKGNLERPGSLILFDPSDYIKKNNKKTLSIIIIHVITILNILLIMGT